MRFELFKANWKYPYLKRSIDHAVEDMNKI